MITHTNRKVVCIKDIPSNLIEEAIFILKTDSRQTKEKYQKIKKEIVLQETNELMNQYSRDFESKAIEEEYRKSLIKLKCIFGSIAICLVGILICFMI